jgi:hypothetical protein
MTNSKINYSDIIFHCKKHSAISAEVIDDFLMYYAAEKEGMEREMNKKFDRFKHIDLGEHHAKYINFLKAEYVVSRIFLKNGLIKKYLNHSTIKQLLPQQYRFLQEQADNPWKFTFARIINQPYDDFFEMEDVFTGDEFLLYSPSTTQTLQASNPILWFLMIGYNGICWQSYGLNIPFKSFDTDDIFFFATELDPSISNEEELIASIEKDPVPFFMLMSASHKPSVYHKQDLMVQCFSSDLLNNFDSGIFKKKFNIAWNEDVYQLNLKNWNEFPHYAIAYYDENKKIFCRTALTQRGFEALNNIILKLGIEQNEEPDIRVSMSMLSALEDILKREIKINPYEKLFSNANADADESALEGHNEFFKLAIPILNERKKPNLIELAKQAGIEHDLAKKTLGLP